MEKLCSTPLTQWHRENGAKMAPFAGFDMPVQYTGILQEHTHTRSQAGIFDISHMGEFKLSGQDAGAALGKIVTHDLENLSPGRCCYGFLLNKSGGILDDLIIYCLGVDSYMLVVNGACRESDFAWISKHLPGELAFSDISDAVAKIDVQGPQSLAVVNDLLANDYSTIPYFGFDEIQWNGFQLIVSRTGYTGELGYELYLPAEKALDVWPALVADSRVKPVGLGARDTLRLEAGYPLYGQDLDTDHTPIEASAGFFLKKKTDYIGKDGLQNTREKLIPLTIEGRRSARHNDEVYCGGTRIGYVTSGSFCPSLGHCVALAYVAAEMEGNEKFTIRTARVELQATKTKLPFYKDGTVRGNG